MASGQFNKEHYKWPSDIGLANYSIADFAVPTRIGDKNSIDDSLFSTRDKQPSLKNHNSGAFPEVWTGYNGLNEIHQGSLTTKLSNDCFRFGETPNKTVNEVAATGKGQSSELATAELFTTKGNATFDSQFSPLLRGWSNEKAYGPSEKIYRAPNPNFDSEFEAAFSASVDIDVESDSNLDSISSETCQSPVLASQSNSQHVSEDSPEIPRTDEKTTPSNPRADTTLSYAFQKQDNSCYDMMELDGQQNIMSTNAQVDVDEQTLGATKSTMVQQSILSQQVTNKIPRQNTKRNSDEHLSAGAEVNQSNSSVPALFGASYLQTATSSSDRFDTLRSEPLMSNFPGNMAQALSSFPSYIYSALPGQGQLILGYARDTQMQLYSDMLSATGQSTIPTTSNFWSLPAIRNFLGNYPNLCGPQTLFPQSDVSSSFFYPQELATAHTNTHSRFLGGQRQNAHPGSRSNLNEESSSMVGVPQSMSMLAYRHLAPLQNYYSCSCGLPNDETMIKCSGTACLTPGYFHRRCAGTVSMIHDGTSWVCLTCRHQQGRFSEVCQNPRALPWPSNTASSELAEEGLSNDNRESSSTSPSSTANHGRSRHNFSSSLSSMDSQLVQSPESSSLIVKLKTGHKSDGESGRETGRALATLRRGRPPRAASNMASLQLRNRDEGDSSLYYSPKLYSNSGDQYRSELPNRRATAWSKWEEDKCIEIMIQVKTSGTVKRIDALWEAVSQRLYEEYRIERTPGGVKNAWNRNLRAKSGFDERLNPQPNRMRTGLLPKLGSGLGWWSQRESETASCLSSTGARKRSDHLDPSYSPSGNGGLSTRARKRRRNHHSSTKDDDSQDEDWIG